MITEKVSQQIFTRCLLSPAGTLQVKSTNDFITEVSFCKEDGNDMHHAEMEIPAVLNECLQQLSEYFKGERKIFDVPISQPGTVFQQAVWNELSLIPFGETISYLELSRRLGNVKAIRAAAASNGKNKIAVIIPCHRVIGSNKHLVGYAGGINRKRWLLQHEVSFTRASQTLF
jgi:methylated-DNA-[protein]-cysteine S-methyltransferase